jgi:hypothetical protein
LAETWDEIALDFIKIVWDDTSLIDNLDRGDEKVHAKVMSVMQYKAPQVEAHMKTNAPWTDQTGNARQGLRAEAFDEWPQNAGIVLYHTVQYGIWLEVKNSGEYAIIQPTIDVMGPEVMRSLENILREI